MNIDDHTIPDVVVNALCNLADRVDATHLLEQATQTPSLFQGHRAIKQNAHVARQHIKLALKSDRKLDPANAAILRKAGLHIDVVIVLSETALTASYAEMAVYFGEADFIAATLLDERESVRELAHAFLSSWDGNQSDESSREMAAKELRSTFTSFLLRMKQLIDETLPPPARTDAGPKAISGGKPDKSLEIARAELARLTKQSISDRKQLQGSLVEKQAEIDRLQIDLTALGKAHDSIKMELAEAKFDVSEIRSTLQQQIAGGVRDALTNKLRGWLEPRIQISEGLEGVRKSNLALRAKDALEKQRATDLHYGNRHELSQLLAQLHQLLADINRARTTAMHPLPELKSIAAELERETHEIQRRLGVGDKKVDPTVAGLLANINAAQSLDELAAVRRFIQQAATYNLLSRENLQSIYRALDNKAGMIYDKAELVGDATPNFPSKRFFLRHAFARAAVHFIH